MAVQGVIPFGPEIWTAEGSIVTVLGFAYPTRMAVVRLNGGGLLLWSPIALTPGLRQEVDALGTVSHLVAPNLLHHRFLPDWQRLYPQARLPAAPGLRRRRRDLVFDGELGDAPDPAWADEIDQVAVRGSFFMTEIVFFHRVSGTALIADLVQNFRSDWFPGWRGWLARWDGITVADPGAPRDLRLTFWDRKAARRAVRRIFAWNAERLVIAHGDLVPRDAAPFIRKAFAWLKADRSA